MLTECMLRLNTTSWQLVLAFNHPHSNKKDVFSCSDEVSHVSNLAITSCHITELH